MRKSGRWSRKKKRGCAAQERDQEEPQKVWDVLKSLPACCSASRSLRSEFITHCLKEVQIYHFPHISSCSTEGICGSRCPDSIRILMIMLVQSGHSILVSKKKKERKKEKKNSQRNISTKEWWGHAVDLCVCPGTQTTVVGHWLADCCPQLHRGYLESF